MRNIKIKVAELEFNEGSHTIWIHSPEGGTVLRIKCTGKVVTDVCQNSPISHGDVIVEGDIHICVSNDTID